MACGSGARAERRATDGPAGDQTMDGDEALKISDPKTATPLTGAASGHTSRFATLSAFCSMKARRG